MTRPEGPSSSLPTNAEGLAISVAYVSLPRRQLPTRRLRVARLISDVFHPELVGLPLFLAITLGSTPSVVQALAWWGVCILLLILPGRLYVRRSLRRNTITDREVSVRAQRTPIYAFALALLALTLGVMVVFGAPRALVASLVGMFLAGVLALVINLKWKISVHGGSIGACATLLTLLYGAPMLLVVVPIVGAVGWSRVVLLQHTPAQVLAGVLVCSATITLVFGAFGLI